MHFGFLQRTAENSKEKVWYTIFLSYVAIIGALFVVFKVHATPVITVCASGCDYTNITSAVTDATLSSGGTVTVQATYDPTGEPSYPAAVITPSYTSTIIDCQNSGAYLGVTDGTATTTFNLIGSNSITNCNARHVNIQTLGTGVTGIAITGNTFDAAAWSSVSLAEMVNPVFQNNTGKVSISLSSNSGASAVNPLLDGNSLVGSNNFSSIISTLFGASGLVAPTNATMTNNTFTITNFDGNWWSYNNGDLDFERNTVTFTGTQSINNPQMSFCGGTFNVSYNYFSFAYDVATPYEHLQFGWNCTGVTNDYQFTHNTVVAPLSSGSLVRFVNTTAGTTATLRSNLFDNLTPVPLGTDSNINAIAFEAELGEGTFSAGEGFNGAHGFSHIISNNGTASIPVSSHDLTEDPHFRRENLSTADDMYPAPWSYYLDGGDGSGIGAYHNSHRTDIYIDASGTVDYNTVDATSTLGILATDSGLKWGDTIHLAPGAYEVSEVATSSYFYGGLTIVGAGSGINGGPVSKIGCFARFVGLNDLTFSHLAFDDGCSQSPAAIKITDANNVTMNDVKVAQGTGSSTNGLSLQRVTGSTFTDLDISGFTSSTQPASTYSINSSPIFFGGSNYTDGPVVGGTVSSTLVMTNGSCDVKTSDEGGGDLDITSLVGDATNNWNVAAVVIHGFSSPARLTMWVPNNIASSGAAIETDCSNIGGGYSITVDKFVSNAFTVSGGSFTYNFDMLQAQGIRYASGFGLWMPQITHHVTKNFFGAGLDITDSGNNTFTNVTSTGNTCGVLFEGASGAAYAQNNLYNFVATSSLEYDLCSDDSLGPSQTYNFLFGPTITRGSVYMKNTGSIMLLYKPRALILDMYGAPVAGATVTIHDSNIGGGITSHDYVTDGDGYVSNADYFMSQQYRPDDFLLIDGGSSGPFVVSAAPINGLYTSSTSADLISQNQLFTVYMSSSAPVIITPPCTTCTGGGPPQVVTPIISSFGINGGATTTASTTVTLGIAANGASQMVFSLNNSFTNTVWQAYSQTSSFILDSALGLKHIYAKVRGSDGGESAVSVQNITLVAESTPQRPVTAPTISAPAYTTSTSVLLAIGYDDTASQMMLSNSSDFVGGVWETLLPTKVWTLPTPDGQKSIYLKVRSGTGIESSVVVAKVILDATAPITPVIANPQNNEKLTTGTITISGTADPHELFVLIVTSGGAEKVHVTLPVSPQGGWSYAVPDDLPVGSYQIVASATDIAGNMSSDTASFTILAAEPLIPLSVDSPQDNVHITKNSFTASGHGKPQSHIVIVQGGATFTSIVDTNGKWSVPISLAAVSDTYAFEYRMVDASSNLLDSVQRTIIVDLPAVPPPPVKKDTPGLVPIAAPAPVAGGVIAPMATSTEIITTTTVPLVVQEPANTTSTTSTVTIPENVAQTVTAQKISETVTAASVSVVKSVRKIRVAAAQIVAAPQVQIANQAVVVPAAAAVVVAGVSTALNFGQIALYFRFLFTQPLFLLTRKRRKGWGMAYNAISKLPADLALVRIINADSGRVVQSHVTDRDGRYQFFARPGNYRLEVTKPNYSFPPAYMQGKTEDGALTDLYTGGTVPLAAAGQISYNLPLAPGGDAKPAREILRTKAKNRLVNILGAGGVVLTAVSFAVSPTIFVGAFLAAQVVSYFVFRRLALPPKPHDWGVVRGSDGKPVAQAIVRVFDTQYNKLLETQITDDQGRYSFLVGKNQYYIMVEKAGFQNLTTEPIIINAPEGSAALAKDVTLQMQAV